MIRASLIATFALALVLPMAAGAQTFTKYDDPFNISAYVTDPAKPIKQAMDQYHWTVESEAPGRILAVYAHKNHEVKVNIFYTADKIWFEQLSAKNLGCKKGNCEVKERHLTNWRVGLRRGIGYQLTLLALEDAKRAASTGR